MNPFIYISNISKKNRSGVDIIKEENPFYKSPEFISLIVLAIVYVFIRLSETYISPLIPNFVIREISSLYRWGPILVPVIFGISFFSKEKNIKNENKSYNDKSYDDLLKKRMFSWTNNQI